MKRYGSYAPRNVEGVGDYKNLVDSSLAGVNRNLAKLLQETETFLSNERKTCASLKDEVEALKLRLHAMDDDRLAVEGKEKLLIGMLAEEEEEKLKFERELKELRNKAMLSDAERRAHLETNRALALARAEERRLRSLVADLQAQAAHGERENEDRARWEGEREALLRQINTERKALEDREKRMREELRNEGKASLQALQSMRQRIGELRRDRRALEEKERELEAEREMRMQLEVEMETMQEKFLEFEVECRRLRESITVGAAGPNEVALRGRIIQVEDEKRALEARLYLAEQERDAIRAQLDRERAEASGKGIEITDRQLEDVRRERCEMEASHGVLRAGLKMRMAQLEEERAARAEAEEAARQVQSYLDTYRSCVEDTERELGKKEKPSVVIKAFEKGKQRTKGPAKTESEAKSSLFNARRSNRPDTERKGLRANDLRPMEHSDSLEFQSRKTQPPPSDVVDKKMKKARTYPIPVANPDVHEPRWRVSSDRRGSSGDVSPPPVLIVEEDSSLSLSSAEWDSDVEADLEIEFETARARALQCIKSGTVSKRSSPVK